MKVTRIYTGDDQRSHFEELDLPLTVSDLGAMSSPIPTETIFFRSTAEAGPEVYDFHVAPRRQLVVHVTGSTEIEVADGERRTFGLGTPVQVFGFVMQKLGARHHRGRRRHCAAPHLLARDRERAGRSGLLARREPRRVHEERRRRRGALLGRVGRPVLLS